MAYVGRCRSAVALAVVSVFSTVRTDAQVFGHGNVLVSSSTYAGTASTVVVGQALPITPTANAISDGTYPGVFNNETPDPNFGITSPISITEYTPQGLPTGVLISVPATTLVTSFSSKSELALNLSIDGTSVTFMGYPAAANQLDLSNSATPGENFSGNTDVAPQTYRAVLRLNSDGTFTGPTDIVAYTGDNARAAVLAGGNYYTVGATGGTLASLAGAQIVTPGGAPPGNVTSLGSFVASDGKPNKDNNFRGLTIFNSTVYTSKGSGSKGVNTVYQVGSAGTLPTGSSNPITILPGFPTSGVATHPFGLWFANATTLYVADEGDGVYTDIGTPANNAAGLSKFSLVSGSWQLDYTMTRGLNLGAPTPYTVNGPSGATYITAPDGLRNITGNINEDGTVTIYAITSTASSAASQTNGTAAVDEGCDPNQFVSITDNLANTSPSVGEAESFNLLATAQFGEVLRGVSFAPTNAATDTPAMPRPALALLAAILAAVGFVALHRKAKA
jgi:hypothetical protein